MTSSIFHHTVAAEISKGLIVQDIRRALFIANSKSRSGKVLSSDALDGLHQRGIAAEMVDCGSPADLHAVIAAQATDKNLIVVGGGDGTLNAAVSGVLETKLPLGILPMGTANDLARTLGIPIALDDALNVIAEQYTKRIDLGSVNGRPFFNVASIGLSVDLARELTPEIKKRFGRLGYALAALRVISRAKPFRVEIRTSNESIKTLSLQIAIGNGKYYGGGNLVTEAADIHDGILDLYSLEYEEAWKLLSMFWSFRRGEHIRHNEVRDLRAKRFEIFTRKPRHVNADGEIVTMTPATFEVLPAVLEVFVPASAVTVQAAGSSTITAL